MCPDPKGRNNALVNQMGCCKDCDLYEERAAWLWGLRRRVGKVETWNVCPFCNQSFDYALPVRGNNCKTLYGHLMSRHQAEITLYML